MMRTAVGQAAHKERARGRIVFGAWEGAYAFFLMAILTRIQLLGDISPFPVACFTAGLFTGMPVLPMLLGCLAGARFETLGIYGLMPLIGNVLSYSIYIGFLKLMGGRRPKSSAGKPRFDSEDAICLSIAGIAALASSLLFSGALEINIFMSFVSAAIAMLIAPVMISALTVKPSRRTLLRDEQMALMLLFILVLLGVRSLPHIGETVAPYLAAALTLVASGQSAGTGAMAGILTGTSLILLGDDPFIAASLGLCGVVAGMVKRMGRPASALAFMLGNTVTMVYGMSYTVGALHPFGAAALAVAYCVIPRSIVEKLWAFMGDNNAVPDANRFILHVRENAESRVRALATVFDELCQGYKRDVAEPPDEQALTGQMRKKLCADCPRYERCWMGESRKAHRLLGGLLADALRGTPLSSGTELPPYVGQICARAGEIPRRLSPLLGEFDRQKRAVSARTEARDLSVRQFEQACEILNNLADALRFPVEVDSDATQLLGAVLDREGLRAGEILALKGNAPMIHVKLEDELWTRETVLAVESRLSRELGVPVRSTYRSGTYDNIVGFEQSARFTATVGMASRPVKNGELSGDHCAAMSLPDNMFMLAISDGMGHGERAARESALTIRLLKRFLSADIRKELALESINSLLNMLGGDEMYATADMCVIDLKNGQAEINKLGACHTSLLRGNGIAHIEGGRLPLGILEKVKPTVSSVSLNDGDLIVMVSDGVADSALSEDRAFLDGLIRAHRQLDPQSLCTEILNTAAARAGAPKDDMTVMAVRIVEN